MNFIPGFLRGVGLALTLLVAGFFLMFTAWVWDYELSHGRWWQSRGTVWLAVEVLVTLFVSYWLAFLAAQWRLSAFVAGRLSCCCSCSG